MFFRRRIMESAIRREKYWLEIKTTRDILNLEE